MIDGWRRLTLAFALTALGCGAAAAQMMLPGALNGNASGSPPPAHKGGGGSGGAPSSYAPPKPIAIKPPGTESILGHTLSFDGSRGAMAFDKSGEDIVLSKLTLAGDKISKPGETCAVDLSTAEPIIVPPAGRPVGALRFTVPIKVCPLTVDVLDGAVLVSASGETCDFTAADCRVSPGGLWGPHAADISAKQSKDLERQRVRLETTMRANFRALLRRAGKDRLAVKAIAKDQAAFSSDREMICRDYEQESTHGFCSTQITQARVLALLAKFGDGPEAAKEHKRLPRPKMKPQLNAKAPPPVTVDETGAAGPAAHN